MNRENLRVGMIVEVKGKYDTNSYPVEIIKLGERETFSHKSIGKTCIISCHQYKDIIKINLRK